MNNNYIFALLLIILSLSCTISKESIIDLSTDEPISIRMSVEQFIKCINQRDEACLQKIFHQDYHGISPVVAPQRKNEFIQSMINNFDKNNLQVGAEIKTIEMGIDMAYVTMNWQIRAIDGSNRELLVDAQRLDIWKKDANIKNWCILGTLIYKEEHY